MKKVGLISLVACLLLSSCASYTGMGAYTGSHIGSILGSAIGGISGGPRGSDIGTIIGMAGGAVAGAAIGNAVERSEQQKLEGYHERVLQKSDARYNRRSNEYSRDDTGTADDRIDFTPSNSANNYSDNSDYSSVRGTTTPLSISHVRFVDEDGDGYLSSGEQAKITFELRNNSQQYAYGVCPVVNEITGTRGVMVSPTVEVESIAPGTGIKYTASVVSYKKMKGNDLQFEVSAVHNNGQVSSRVQTIRVGTKR